MRRHYRVGHIVTLLGAGMIIGPPGAFAVDPGQLPSISKKIDPSRCYWLEAKMTAEGLCGARLAPNLPVIIQEAEQGNILAAYRLGQLYTNGNWGVEKDIEKGVQWYTRSAEGGFRHAQIKLGFMYEHGRGVAKDLSKAAYWYEQAVEHGIYPDLEEKVERLRAEKLSNKNDAE